MHRTGAGPNQLAALLGDPSPGEAALPWNTTCTNCDAPLPAGSTAQTFCGDACRATAAQIRDLRRQGAAGIDTSKRVQALDREIRLRVESAIPLRGCDAEDWTTFVRWFQDADQG